MNKISIFIISIILLFIVAIIITYSVIIFTLIISVLAAFIAFIAGNWIWKYINAPEISISFPNYSSTSGIKQPQSKDRIPTFILEINNKGISAARNSLLYFSINSIKKICKWNSVPEPISYQYLYDVYQRLTLLQDLPEYAAFAFRFLDDPPYLLRQYDLISRYTNTMEKCSNKIDCRTKKAGELIIYSEDYQGICGISFFYYDKKKKIIITLYKLKLKERHGFKSLSIDKSKNTFEIPSSNENKK